MHRCISGVVLTGIFGVFVAFSGLASAEVYAQTGDLDVGPAADITHETLMCSDANIFFQMFERRPAIGRT